MRGFKATDEQISHLQFFSLGRSFQQATLRVMISIALPLVEFASFVALLVLVGRISLRPRWRVRAVLYGWGFSVILAGIWAVLLPLLCERGLDTETIEATFPGGTLVIATLTLGWIWPMVAVGIAYGLEHRKNGHARRYSGRQ